MKWKKNPPSSDHSGDEDTDQEGEKNTRSSGSGGVQHLPQTPLSPPHSSQLASA